PTRWAGLSSVGGRSSGSGVECCPLGHPGRLFLVRAGCGPRSRAAARRKRPVDVRTHDSRGAPPSQTERKGEATMDPAWRIELLGRLRATWGDAVVTRFRARRTGSLLGYLAYHLDRPHPRELLIELLWPGGDLHSGRNNLRRELTSLRRQLEPP